MAVRPESIEEWCHLVPHLLLEEGWQTILENGSSSMSCCSSPWGGSLLRIVLRDLLVVDPPEDPADLLVRPETKIWSWQVRPELSAESCTELSELAPGDCVMHLWGRWKMLKLLDVVFGCLDHFSHHATLRERLRRNFPERGDCASVIHDVRQVLDWITFTRRQPDRFYTMQLLCGIPSGIHPTQWVVPHLRLTLDVVRSTAAWYLNMPGCVSQRRFDQTFYVVLTMSSFKRGWPMIPTDDPEDKDVTVIQAGQSQGLANWVQYVPLQHGHSHFCLSDYLQLFLERMGETMPVHQSLDGQDVLPYQCVVAREHWCRMHERFHPAFALQKAAYRRAKGGKTAPKIVEDIAPRLWIARYPVQFGQEWLVKGFGAAWRTGRTPAESPGQTAPSTNNRATLEQDASPSYGPTTSKRCCYHCYRQFLVPFDDVSPEDGSTSFCSETCAERAHEAQRRREDAKQKKLAEMQQQT
ncbi:Slc9a8 [Symbiodinium natans]|uniref:Slc9a8 protein n=1 Tax=Symbiodinium natans TaxID=878477 RepID=A0A812JTN7_9DINO|nr:Slc9a8 [Symbiodinium natans]